MTWFGEALIAPCSQTEDRIVYDSCQTLYRSKLYRESFAPGCFLPREASNPARVRLGHEEDGGIDVGVVTVTSTHGKWHTASFMLDGPNLDLALERVVPGAKVSIGFRSLRRYEDRDLRLVRHTLCTLNELAILEPGAVPGHIGAVVTHIREFKPKPGPVKVQGYTLQPGEELLDGRGVVVARNVDGRLEFAGR